MGFYLTPKKYYFRLSPGGENAIMAMEIYHFKKKTIEGTSIIKFHYILPWWDRIIRADQKRGTEIGVSIHYWFIINHISCPYCQENPWKSTERDLWYI